MKSQFFLAQYNISIRDSNELALFEFEAYMDLALEQEQRKIDEVKAETSALSRMSRFSGKS